MALKDRIREARKTAGATQKELADAAGVSPQAVSQWERGEDNPSRDNLRAAAKFLKVTIDWLLEGTATEPDLSSEDVSATLEQDSMRDQIRVALDANPQLSKGGLADALGVANSAITSLLKPGGRQIKAHEAVRIERYLGISLRTETPLLMPNRPAPAKITAALRVGDMPRDVPIMGNAYGGDEADFCFTGQVTDYGRRPPRIERDATVFGIYVSGNSMAPRFKEGELVYASSARPPAVGDYVIVELKPKRDGDDVLGYIKELVKRTPTKLVVRQLNPDKTIEFELKRIKAIHRVVPWTELLGG